MGALLYLVKYTDAVSQREILKKSTQKKGPGTKAQPLESYICHRGNQIKTNVWRVNK